MQRGESNFKQGGGRHGPQFEVIVLNLPFTSSEDDIYDHFEKIGDITSVKVMMGHDGRPRGKAFIKFGSEDSMNAALTLTGSSLGGRNITVELTDKMKGEGHGGFGGQGGQGSNWRDAKPRGDFGDRRRDDQPQKINFKVENPAYAMDKPKSKGGEYEVIVLNLPFNASEDDVWAHFDKVGDITNVKLMIGQDGRPRGKAFIKFGHEDSMNAALALSGSSLSGRNITVELTNKMKGEGQGGYGGSHGGYGGFQGSNWRDRDSKPRRDFRDRSDEDRPENTNVMVKNLAFSVDETKLEGVFADCGPIKCVRIIKDESGRSRGFGFIDFTDLDSAKNALKKAGESIDGRGIDVMYSRPR